MHHPRPALTRPVPGVRLRQWLGMDETLFYDERHVAIVPMGTCFPGQNDKGADLPPRRECAPAWRAELLSHLSAVELILCLGRPAQLWHLGKLADADLTSAAISSSAVKTPRSS